MQFTGAIIFTRLRKDFRNCLANFDEIVSCPTVAPARGPSMRFSASPDGVQSAGHDSIGAAGRQFPWRKYT
jgi:hypothetical protein